MKYDRRPKDVLYSELAKGHCPAFCFKGIYNQDLKLTSIKTDSWEVSAYDQRGWCYAVQRKGKGWVGARKTITNSWRAENNVELKLGYLIHTPTFSSEETVLLCKDQIAEPFWVQFSIKLMLTLQSATIISQHAHTHTYTCKYKWRHSWFW